jgi:hypothetical protein
MFDALATALRAADVRSGGLIAAGAGMEKPVIATSTGSPSVKLKAILSIAARQGPLGPTFSKTGLPELRDDERFLRRAGTF